MCIRDSNYREAAEAAETDADNKLPTMEELEAAAQHCDICLLYTSRCV